MEIDTFSANSLKILDRDLSEFENKYIYNLSLFKHEKRADLGQKFHGLIASYLKGYDVEKLLLNLDSDEIKHWKNLKIFLDEKKKQGEFIKVEYPFLLKDKLKDKPYFLTGRFDAIYKERDNYYIYDWKTLNLPYSSDLQTIVYLYSASKIFNTDKIKMVYLSIEKMNNIEIKFENVNNYKTKIDEVINKYYFKQ